jgi:hypothetical protein
MNWKVIAAVMALGSAGCSSLAPQSQLLDVEDFPPPVFAGVTRFAQVAPPDPPPPDTAVPPTNILGVTRFAEVAEDKGVPDSAVPKAVYWVRFGVTPEMAARESALAGNPPAPAQGKGN